MRVNPNRFWMSAGAVAVGVGLLSALAVPVLAQSAPEVSDGAAPEILAAAKMPLIKQIEQIEQAEQIEQPVTEQPVTEQLGVEQDVEQDVEHLAVSADMRLVLSLEARQVSLYQGERLVSSYPVAIGAAETPTPQGQFTVSQMIVEPMWQSPWTGELHEPGLNSALGLRWIGFSTSDRGSFGFHGTPTVNSIGQAASNGCVRMHNQDIVALFEQVVPGMPVLVIP